MEQLKKQVNSLEVHQKKLKEELESIEEKFDGKRKKILDSAAEFENEMEKVGAWLVFLDKNFGNNFFCV